MSEFGDNIRKIARYEELKKLITQAQNAADQAQKLALKGQRAIAYLDPKTLTTAATSGAKGQSKPDNNGIDNPTGNEIGKGVQDGVSEAIKGAGDILKSIGNNGSSDDLDNPDNSTKDGVYDAQSILDGLADTYGKLPPGADQVLNAITGLTTDDGLRKLLVSLRDAAYSFVPPDNWDSAFGPGPTDPSYNPGRTWMIISGGTPYFAPSFNSLISVREEVDGTTAYGYAGGSVTGDPVNGQDIIFSFTPGAPIGSTPGGTTYAFQTYAGGIAINIGRYGQQDCGVTPGDSASCSADPPTSSQWTDLGITQLAWVTPLTGGISPLTYAAMGRFIPNPFDVNVPTEYADGSSILDVKTLAGDEVRIGPLRDGGWYMYYRDPLNNNLPIGSTSAATVYTVGSNKVPNGFVTPSALVGLLPI